MCRPALRSILYVLVAALVGMAPTVADASMIIQRLLFEGVTYLNLDGVYYKSQPGEITLGDDGSLFANPTLTMTNCHRRSGLGQQTTNWAWWYSGGFRVVYLDTAAGSPTANRVDNKVEGGAPVLYLYSATHDIVCDGAVPSPGVIFAAGFE